MVAFFQFCTGVDVAVAGLVIGFYAYLYTR